MPFTKGHKTNVGRRCSQETRKKIGAANSIANIGNKHSEETKRKIGIASTGRTLSEEARQKISESKRGEKAYNWEGDQVSYSGLHKWINRELGKPDICEHCGTQDKKLDWANKSQEYKRELTDWIRLCRSCHLKYDYKHGRNRQGGFAVNIELACKAGIIGAEKRWGTRR